jgi:hypothetical protein
MDHRSGLMPEEQNEEAPPKRSRGERVFRGGITSVRFSEEEEKMLEAIREHEHLANVSETIRQIVRETYRRLPANQR